MLAIVLATALTNVVDIREIESAPMVLEFYAPWCAHCKRFEPEYLEASKAVPNIPWNRMNCDIEDCAVFGVVGYPTVVYVSKSMAFKYYFGPHTAQPLANWVGAQIGENAQTVNKPVHKIQSIRQHKTATHVDSIKGMCELLSYADAVIQRDGLLNLELSLNLASMIEKVIPWANLTTFGVFTKENWNLHFCYKYHKKPSLFCKDSKPCLIWTVMHALISASESPVNTLLATTTVVRDLFPCKDCSEHLNRSIYGETAGIGPAAHLESHEGAVLWLWRVHNEVNSRLEKEQFPGVNECRVCSTSSDIYAYLEATYGNSLITTPHLPLAALTAMTGPFAALIAHAIRSPSL